MFQTIRDNLIEIFFNLVWNVVPITTKHSFKNLSSDCNLSNNDIIIVGQNKMKLVWLESRGGLRVGWGLGRRKYWIP